MKNRINKVLLNIYISQLSFKRNVSHFMYYFAFCSNIRNIHFDKKKKYNKN